VLDLNSNYFKRKKHFPSVKDTGGSAPISKHCVFFIITSILLIGLIEQNVVKNIA